MQRRTAIACLLALWALAPGVILAAGDVTVTASYTGKGRVDETHEILVFLFDHPVPTAESQPIAMLPIHKSGGTATFKVASPDTVYVVAVFDEKANYDGRSGPPPLGTPIATYGKGGKPLPVKTAANAKITVSFDDSRRWGQPER